LKNVRYLEKLFLAVLEQQLPHEKSRKNREVPSEIKSKINEKQILPKKFN
jgi:hypothetical protein